MPVPTTLRCPRQLHASLRAQKMPVRPVTPKPVVGAWDKSPLQLTGIGYTCNAYICVLVAC